MRAENIADTVGAAQIAAASPPHLARIRGASGYHPRAHSIRPRHIHRALVRRGHFARRAPHRRAHAAATPASHVHLPLGPAPWDDVRIEPARRPRHMGHAQVARREVPHRALSQGREGADRLLPVPPIEGRRAAPLPPRAPRLIRRGETKPRMVELLAHVHRRPLVHRTATCHTTRRASSCAPRRCTTRATAPPSSRWSTTSSRHSDATRYYTSRRDRHGIHAVKHRALTHRHHSPARAEPCARCASPTRRRSASRSSSTRRSAGLRTLRTSSSRSSYRCSRSATSRTSSERSPRPAHQRMPARCAAAVRRSRSTATPLLRRYRRTATGRLIYWGRVRRSAQGCGAC